MTISDIILRVKEFDKLNISIDFHYSHPTLYFFVVSDEFSSIEHEARISFLAREMGMSSDDLLPITSNPTIEFKLLTDAERTEDYGFLNGISSNTSWLNAFNPLGVNNIPPQSKSVGTDSHKAIHFYGYKGGQGRSTVLLALAKNLSNAGYRVLLVDADIEAPSLDAMLNVASLDINSTLMGLLGNTSNFNPLEKVYVGSPNEGYIDLVTARPFHARYDMDFAAFLMNSSFDSGLLQNAIRNLRDKINNDGHMSYDIILFDHRTGLAPSVLPIMSAWPGSSVIFARTDGMARHIQDSKLIDILLGCDNEYPGAFVSFSLDPIKSNAELRNDNSKFVESLLEKIGDSMGIEENEVDPQELEAYWIFWRHDQAFIDGGQPDPINMSTINRQALEQLRSVLGIIGNKHIERAPITLTSSGSSDEGLFIQTPWLARLFSKDSPYTYIFGRKGTGKTRLLSELVKNELAEPLLVAIDYKNGGLKSAGMVFNKLLAICDNNFDFFFWALLNAALKMSHTKENNGLEHYIENNLSSLVAMGPSIAKQDLSADKKRVFIIDGVETAVPAAKLRSFVEALFRFLSAIQYDSFYSKFITIRLVLRSDLAQGAAQNIEQQIEGAVINLHWTKTAILNFALARIVSLQWFDENFSGVCERIREKSDKISRGDLPDGEAEALLLEIFPNGLERNRLKATTFFSTYFSDAGGDVKKDSAFYPRLFDGFLRTLAENCSNASTGNIESGRLSSQSVLKAYDQASASFIEDVRTELYSFLNIEKDDNEENQNQVNKLVAAFNGLQTPFTIETITPIIHQKTGIAPDIIRQSIVSMQKIGIFELRPGYPGEFRTRQIYKSGLGMKYVRKKSL
ncbi:ParA family protein [Aeromonas hydrophila]|uniref:ParA family protein n=1 Tax=Aeromonas hydrophila TaxID=644 RepID=UPI0009BA7E91|nr:AAA family ATPase [Aeromonas hydrophila]EIS3745377.1 ParA family protein [Aeromonas hydrophila]